MMKMAFRVVGALVFSAIVLLAGGFAYEQMKLACDQQRYPAPGQLVDVGGRRMHILCKGDASGPTIVMETGAGDSSYRVWGIQDRISEFARVCVYDRAGLGWSDPVPEGRSLQQRADDLHALLTNANVQKPFVLAAHSMGGLLVRLFARDHADEVAGLVLIDVSEEGLNFGPLSKEFDPQTDRFIDVLQEAYWSARFGLLPLFQKLHPELATPAQFPESARAMFERPATFRAGREDLVAIRSVPASMHEPGSFGGPLGDLPMAVIVHGIIPLTAPQGMREALLEAQQRLAALSTNSIKIVAQNSRHYIYLDEPDIVIDAVRRVHAAARDGQPLNRS